MNTRIALRLLPLVTMLALAGCSSDSAPVDATTGTGMSGGSTVARMEAPLRPIPSVDASGNARREDRAGTQDDRFDVEIEIFSGDFGAVGIDAADGFADESVLLSGRRSGVEVYVAPMVFSEDRRAGGAGDVTWELSVRGGSLPDLRPGDVIRVDVNDVVLLEGTLVAR